MCTFRVRSAVVTVVVDSSPSPSAVLERKAVEEAQLFTARRLVPAPEHVGGEGIDAYWFPLERNVMTTDGVRLITATVVRWPGMSQGRRRALAVAAARPYLGRNRPDLAHGPA